MNRQSYIDCVITFTFTIMFYYKSLVLLTYTDDVDKNRDVLRFLPFTDLLFITLPHL